MSDSVTKKPKLVTRTITVKIPREGTGFDETKVRCVFEIIGRKEAEAIVKEDGAPLMERVLKGWGAADGSLCFKDPESDAKIPFSEENIGVVNDVPYYNAALVKGYFEAANGGKLGN